jgi:hypothetical protein
MLEGVLGRVATGGQQGCANDDGEYDGGAQNQRRHYETPEVARRLLWPAPSCRSGGLNDASRPEPECYSSRINPTLPWLAEGESMAQPAKSGGKMMAKPPDSSRFSRISMLANRAA